MSIQSISIENFRCFRRFEMGGLGRINLIVGANNSGKTTVLGAISILMSHGNPSNIWAALNRRREFTWFEVDETASRTAKYYEISQLFHGYEIDLGAAFRLSAESSGGPVKLVAEVNDKYPLRLPGGGVSHAIHRANLSTTSWSHPRMAEGDATYTGFPEGFGAPWNVTLSWTNHESQGFDFPMSRQGLVADETIPHRLRADAGDGRPIPLVSSSALTPDSAAAFFNEVVLTPEEDLVIDALKMIEPGIERIASAVPKRVQVGTALLHPSSIFVKLNGTKNRIPMGSMGEGIWRMLSLAMQVVNSRGEILLIDDIDTGLHHTVRESMWRFLDSAARRYNVQVFATTHSRDCYESLAVICDRSEDGDVTMQRIERGREDAVAYSERAIIAAARHDIEVR